MPSPSWCGAAWPGTGIRQGVVVIFLVGTNIFCLQGAGARARVREAVVGLVGEHTTVLDFTQCRLLGDNSKYYLVCLTLTDIFASTLSTDLRERGRSCGECTAAWAAAAPASTH